MKKIYFLFCFLLMAASACKKEGSLSANKILGKWLLKKVEYTQHDENNKLVGYATTGFSATDYMLFNKDKTGESVIDDNTPFGPQIIRFTYTVDQSNINIKYQYEQNIKTYQINVINKNQVILVYNHGRPAGDLGGNATSETYLTRP